MPSPNLTSFSEKRSHILITAAPLFSTHACLAPSTATSRPLPRMIFSVIDLALRNHDLPPVPINPDTGLQHSLISHLSTKVATSSPKPCLRTICESTVAPVTAQCLILSPSCSKKILRKELLCQKCNKLRLKVPRKASLIWLQDK